MNRPPTVKHEIVISGSGPLTVGNLMSAVAEVADKPDAIVHIDVHHARDMRDNTSWTLRVTW